MLSVLVICETKMESKNAAEYRTSSEPKLTPCLSYLTKLVNTVKGIGYFSQFYSQVRLSLLTEY